MSFLKLYRSVARVILPAMFGLAVVLTSGCGKSSEAPPAVPAASTSPPSQPAPAPNTPNTAPGPMATPATPEAVAPADTMEATLAQLTRELHRTMIGRRLSGSFEEFVQIRNLQVPPPPAGKKYAISKQWRVVLVDK